jgi:polygalacturonase
MEINILELGAKGDGKTDNTKIIQEAIDHCHDYGGGKVVIPQGEYLCKPLRLRSNVTLYLEEGSILKASSNINDYNNIGYYHNEWGKVTSFLYALSEKNIAIEGKGIIDLSGESFMDFLSTHNNFIELSLLNKEQFEETECKTKERPKQPIFFYNCKNIFIRDVIIKDSPCWTISINSSEDIRVDGIQVINNLRVPNSDGLHFCSSKRIYVFNSTFICGDDCVALTGITNWDRPCEDVIISNCIMETRSAGVRIGHLDSKVRNVLLSNLIIRNSNRGIGIFANGKSGYVNSVIVNNIIMETKIFAGTWWGKGEPIAILAPEFGNTIENVSISNIITNSENGILIYGKDKNIKNVVLKDIDINITLGKNREIFGKYLDLSPNTNIPFPDYMRKIPWIIGKDIFSLKLENVTYGISKDLENKINVEGILEDISKLSIFNIISKTSL